MMSFTMKGFIDMAMVGELGTDVLGAVGIGSVAAWVALTFPWGILRGQRPLVAGSTDLPTEAVGHGRDYFQTRMAWALPTLLTMAIAEYLRSVGKTRVPMVVDLLVHPLNVLFNWMLIFGHLGLPEMGAKGAALGTGLADVVGLLLLLFLAAPPKSARAALDSRRSRCTMPVFS
jgi:Na+-driven multidrug efflux pump